MSVQYGSAMREGTYMTEENHHNCKILFSEKIEGIFFPNYTLKMYFQISI